MNMTLYPYVKKSIHKNPAQRRKWVKVALLELLVSGFIILTLGRYEWEYVEKIRMKLIFNDDGE